MSAAPARAERGLNPHCTDIQIGYTGSFSDIVLIMGARSDELNPPETKPCWSCGDQMVYRALTHIEQVGKATVTDATDFAFQCSACGETEITTSMLAGYELRAAALVLRDGRHTTGTVLRYARKALGLKQSELAALLGRCMAQVSRAERGAHKHGQAEILAIVALLEGAARGEDVKARLAERPAQDDFVVLPRTG